MDLLIGTESPSIFNINLQKSDTSFSSKLLKEDLNNELKIFFIVSKLYFDLSFILRKLINPSLSPAAINLQIPLTFFNVNSFVFLILAFIFDSKIFKIGLF